LAAVAVLAVPAAGVAVVWRIAVEGDLTWSEVRSAFDGDGAGEPVLSSGYLEGRSVLVSAEVGGSVAELAVGPGDRVRAGDLLLRLRDDGLVAQRRQAAAAVAGAAARLEQLSAGPPPAQLQAAEAAERRAHATAQRAESAWRLATEAAARSAPGAGAELGARADEARVSHEVAAAALQLARARLALARAGPSAADERLAQAAVRRAEAALALSDLYVERLAPAAPSAGLVADVLVTEGEAVVAGTPLVQLVDTDPLALRVFLAEADLDGVGPGTAVEITVDALDGGTYLGRVAHVAATAEFTPRTAQTARDRSAYVFAVTIRVPNPDGRLRPGLAAEARLTP